MSKVVQAVLIVAAAAIAIFEGLTNMVGFVFAALGFVGLIAAAIIIGFATRPARSPAVPEKPRQFKEDRIRRRVEIRAGRVTTVKLPVVKGNYVYGRLWEKDGFDFTWAIVDPKALGLMERGAVFLAQRFERDVSTATADWTVPSDGPWFLAFDATGKQYIREVEIDLWRRSET